MKRRQQSPPPCPECHHTACPPIRAKAPGGAAVPDVYWRPGTVLGRQSVEHRRRGSVADASRWGHRKNGTSNRRAPSRHFRLLLLLLAQGSAGQVLLVLVPLERIHRQTKAMAVQRELKTPCQILRPVPGPLAISHLPAADQERLKERARGKHSSAHHTGGRSWLQARPVPNRPGTGLGLLGTPSLFPTRFVAYFDQ